MNLYRIIHNIALYADKQQLVSCSSEFRYLPGLFGRRALQQ